MRDRSPARGFLTLATLALLMAVAGLPAAQGSSPVTIVEGPYAGVVGVPVQVRAITEIREIAGVYWEFGDGSSDRGLRAAKVFEAAGVYDVTVTVKDENGRAFSAATTAVIASARAIAE